MRKLLNSSNRSNCKEPLLEEDLTHTDPACSAPLFKVKTPSTSSVQSQSGDRAFLTSSRTQGACLHARKMSSVTPKGHITRYNFGLRDSYYSARPHTSHSPAFHQLCRCSWSLLSGDLLVKKMPSGSPSPSGIVQKRESLLLLKQQNL